MDWASRKTTTGATTIIARHPKAEKARLKSHCIRLFMLLHASECSEPGKCRHVYCTENKDLLEHILCCKDSSCNVKHCKTSRLLWKHYHKCDDCKCTICVPVEEALRNDHLDDVRRRLTFTEEKFAGTKRKLTF